MTLSNLKAEIIQKVNSSENFELLSEVIRLMDIHSFDEEVYELSEEQQSALKEARAEYNSGNFLTDDEANNEVNSWLEK
jgi:hypothetical protein